MTLRFFPLGLLFLFVVGCGGPERTVYRGGNSFIPLLDGRVLKYDEQRSGATHSYTMTMHYAGGHVAKIYPLEIKGADFGECSFVGNDSMVFFATSDPFTTIEPRDVLPEYRQLWVDARLKPTQTWIDDDTGTETTFSGLESVEVPAGHYENCYKTLTRARPELFDTLSAWRERGEIKPAEYAHERENAEQIVVRWFAPGVGLVKEQIGSAIIRVLTGIEKEGTGLTDTTRLEQYEIQG